MGWPPRRQQGPRKDTWPAPGRAPPCPAGRGSQPAGGVRGPHWPDRRRLLPVRLQGCEASLPPHPRWQQVPAGPRGTEPDQPGERARQVWPGHCSPHGPGSRSSGLPSPGHLADHLSAPQASARCQACHSQGLPGLTAGTPRPGGSEHQALQDLGPAAGRWHPREAVGARAPRGRKRPEPQQARPRPTSWRRPPAPGSSPQKRPGCWAQAAQPARLSSSLHALLLPRPLGPQTTAPPVPDPPQPGRVPILPSPTPAPLTLPPALAHAAEVHPDV